jgi:hypothetical protein
MCSCVRNSHLRIASRKCRRLLPSQGATVAVGQSTLDCASRKRPSTLSAPKDFAHALASMCAPFLLSPPPPFPFRLRCSSCCFHSSPLPKKTRSPCAACPLVHLPVPSRRAPNMHALPPGRTHLGGDDSSHQSGNPERRTITTVPTAPPPPPLPLAGAVGTPVHCSYARRFHSLAPPLRTSCGGEPAVQFQWGRR